MLRREECCNAIGGYVRRQTIPSYTTPGDTIQLLSCHAGRIATPRLLTRSSGLRRLRPQSPRQELSDLLSHHLARSRWKDFVTTCSNLIPRIRELELIHRSKQQFASLSPAWRLIEHLAQRFDDRRSDEASVAIRSLCDALKSCDERVSPVICKTSTDRRDCVSLTLFNF
jgi:hypothetical protein